jgi:hypothetical protein
VFWLDTGNQSLVARSPVSDRRLSRPSVAFLVGAGTSLRTNSILHETKFDVDVFQSRASRFEYVMLISCINIREVKQRQKSPGWNASSGVFVVGTTCTVHTLNTICNQLAHPTNKAKKASHRQEGRHHATLSDLHPWGNFDVLCNTQTRFPIRPDVYAI